MNPYYQVPAEERHRSKKGVLAAVVVVVTVPVILIGLWAISSLVMKSENPREPGGQLSGEAESASGAQEPWSEETVEDTGAPETDTPAVDTLHTETPDIWGPLPDPDRAVSYFEREEVEAWAPQVALCLERIQAQIAADEIVSIGLFDFEPDGRPEVVVGRQEADASAGYPGRYMLTVYDLDGMETAILEVGDEFPTIMHRSREGKYPCMASYSYDYSIRDADGTSVRESYLIMADEWPKTKVVYGMRRAGSTVTYTVDGVIAHYEAYTARMETVKAEYTDLSDTAMGVIRLTSAMDARERAETLVTLRQAFVRP